MNCYHLAKYMSFFFSFQSGKNQPYIMVIHIFVDGLMAKGQDPHCPRFGYGWCASQWRWCGPNQFFRGMFYLRSTPIEPSECRGKLLSFASYFAVNRRVTAFWSMPGWWLGTWILFYIYWEFHNSNWFPYFFRGVGQPPTRPFEWRFKLACWPASSFPSSSHRCMYFVYT